MPIDAVAIVTIATVRVIQGRDVNLTALNDPVVGGDLMMVIRISNLVFVL